MKRITLCLTGLLAATTISLWYGARQHKHTTLLKQELAAQSAKIKELTRLKDEIANHPISLLPDKSNRVALEEARRELFKLRGEAKRIREAAKWDTADLERRENETRSALAEVARNQEQQQALTQLAAEGKMIAPIADGIANLFANILDKNPEAPFPESIEQLKALTTKNVTNQRLLDYLENSLSKVVTALEENNMTISAFETVRENRFFADGQPRWFIRTKTTTQMPDGRHARSYWPIWTKNFDTKAYAEFRLHSEVHEDTSHYIKLVYE